MFNMQVPDKWVWLGEVEGECDRDTPQAGWHTGCSAWAGQGEPNPAGITTVFHNTLPHQWSRQHTV